MCVVSNFTEPLEIEQTDDGWKLGRELVYAVGRKGSGNFVIVPEGFEAGGRASQRSGGRSSDTRCKDATARAASSMTS